MENHAPTPPTGYDKQAVSLGRVVFIAMVSLIILVLVSIGGRTAFIIAKEKVYTEQVLKQKSDILIELEEHESEVLTSYGVVDAENGIYRIPIEEAMDIIASRSQ
jgi:hypothetical protein